MLGHQRHVADLPEVPGERLLMRGVLGGARRDAAAQLDEEARHGGPVLGATRDEPRPHPSEEERAPGVGAGEHRAERFERRIVGIEQPEPNGIVHAQEPAEQRRERADGDRCWVVAPACRARTVAVPAPDLDPPRSARSRASVRPRRRSPRRRRSAGSRAPPAPPARPAGAASSRSGSGVARNASGVASASGSDGGPDHSTHLPRPRNPRK